MVNKSSRVFIIEPLRRELNISSARIYGHLTYIFDNDVRRCSVFKHKEYGHALLERLRGHAFKPEHDYIVIVGTMLTVAMSIIVIAQAYTQFNILLFNSIENKYVPKQINGTDWK